MMKTRATIEIVDAIAMLQALESTGMCDHVEISVASMQFFGNRDYVILHRLISSLVGQVVSDCYYTIFASVEQS